MSGPAYQPIRPSRSLVLPLRGLQHHIRLWGEPEHRPLVLLHGSLDMSATWQFVVDQMQMPAFVIAPDWRGHGLSEGNPQGYWFQDYLGDLDALLDHVLPGRSVDLVGHSLGGHVAGVYAGTRPERVAHLVALDAFGMLDQDVAQTPDHLRAWLDAWLDVRREGKGTSRAYASLEDVAARLQRANPRLTQDKAAFLAPHMSKSTAEGHVWSFDPLHRLPFALRHRKAEWDACMQRVTAPTLWVASDRPPRFEHEPGGLAARRALVRDLAFVKVRDTSHNLHHEKPERVAQLIEDFLAGRRPQEEETT